MLLPDFAIDSFFLDIASSVIDANAAGFRIDDFRLLATVTDGTKSLIYPPTHPQNPLKLRKADIPLLGNNH